MVNVNDGQQNSEDDKGKQRLAKEVKIRLDSGKESMKVQYVPKRLMGVDRECDKLIDSPRSTRTTQSHQGKK